MRKLILLCALLIPTLTACGLSETETIHGAQSLEKGEVLERFTSAMGAQNVEEGAATLLSERPWETSSEKSIPRCQATTRIGLSTSALAFSGCPDDASAIALAYAWTAESLADGCVLGTADCGDASLAAALSASYWETILGPCSLGEAAALAELTAAASCLRLDEQGSPNSTPTAAPASSPTPSNDSPPSPR